MAGKKGRSGGPRANSGGRRSNAGGWRPGAGRKADSPVLVDDQAFNTCDPIEWLKACMNSEAVPMKFRLQAAAILRERPIAPLEVLDAMYMRAMRGSVSAQIAILRMMRRNKRNT